MTVYSTISTSFDPTIDIIAMRYQGFVFSLSNYVNESITPCSVLIVINGRNRLHDISHRKAMASILSTYTRGASLGRHCSCVGNS